MQRPGHLCLQARDLPPSTEWQVSTTGWRILRLSLGAGYCLGPEPALDLALGDVLLLPPDQAVVLRASRLGPAEFHYFDFQPELLSSLLTLTERSRFDEIAHSPERHVWRLPASHPVARQFAEVCEHTEEAVPLLERTQMLAIAAALLAPELRHSCEPETSVTAARARFAELMNELPQAELLSRSPGELASLCHCSARYFVRLFRARFGESFRSRQIRLRLERACELLRESDAEVSAVAAASGYQSQRMFALHFRREFGTSPARWRKTSHGAPEQT